MQTKESPKINAYQSSVYPDLLIAQNYLEQFVSEVPPNFDIQTIHPKDQKNVKYTNFMKKLFKQLKITKETLWICTLKSTLEIHVYFSQPEYYPISKCCKKTISVQFNCDNSGKITCLQCQRKICDFVFSQFDDSQKQNGTIFLQIKRNIEIRKNMIKKNIVNDAFKVKNLQQNFLKPKNSKKWCKNVQKGGFIVQMSSTISSEKCLKQSDNLQSFVDLQQLPKNLQQIKLILEDIFA